MTSVNNLTCIYLPCKGQVQNTPNNNVDPTGLCWTFYYNATKISPLRNSSSKPSGLALW